MVKLAKYTLAITLMFTLTACSQNEEPSFNETTNIIVVEEQEMSQEALYLFSEESDDASVEEGEAEYVAIGIDYVNRQEELSELKEKISSVEIGDRVRFGGHDWSILDIQDGKALILSDKALSERRFRTSVPRVVVEDPTITWETSSFRRYLNGTFYENTFTSDEKKLIVETKIVTNSNPWFGARGGNDTMDKIFLLSYEEVVKYFGDSGQLDEVPEQLPAGRREAAYIDDQYNELRIVKNIETGLPSLWWLRSPGYSLEAAHIRNDGRIYMGMHYNEHLYTIFGGIRPALWLDLDV